MTDIYPEYFKGFSSVEETLKKFRISFLTFDQHYQKAVDILADHGWYVSNTMLVGDILASALKAINKDGSAVNNQMTRFYNSELKSIIKNISSLYPERKEIFKEALTCHIQKKYHASTLIFLSQCDGICDGKMFKIKNNKKALKEFLPSKQSFLNNPLVKIRGIDSSIDQAHLFNSDLNRHKVIHGHDTHFGTKTNSFKALSLLNYVCEIVHRQTY